MASFSSALPVPAPASPFLVSLSFFRRTFSLSMSTSSSSSARFGMSSSSTSSCFLPPDNCIIVGVGGVAVDFLAAVASYPKPDDKIRTTSLKVQGGGNAGNALTCASRLGLKPRIISKIADDYQGRGILEELEADGVDTSFLVVSKEGISPFTYVIVDSQTNTRTCIHTPGYPPMIPDELSQSSLLSALDGTRLIYSDVRLHETALVVAREAACRNIPLLIDAEKKREGLDDLMKMASYIVCSAKFPQEWTEAHSIPLALTSILQQFPNVKFIVATLGEDGCIMLERRKDDDSQTEELDVDKLFDSLKNRKEESIATPTCVSSEDSRSRLPITRVYERQNKPVAKLKANGIGTVHGRLFLGTAEKIPPSELVDTTGAGDAFIGAVLYGICCSMPPEIMLPFAAHVAAACCRALGARTGLPHRTDSLLSSFMK